MVWLPHLESTSRSAPLGIHPSSRRAMASGAFEDTTPGTLGSFPLGQDQETKAQLSPAIKSHPGFQKETSDVRPRAYMAGGA